MTLKMTAVFLQIIGPNSAGRIPHGPNSPAPNITWPLNSAGRGQSEVTSTSHQLDITATRKTSPNSLVSASSYSIIGYSDASYL